jgi:hypothetical protein
MGKAKTESGGRRTHIKAWLKESTPKFDLMLLKGGPGSGKSSLMKRMAVALTEDDPLQPLYFVELQHFDLEGGLEKSIEKYIKNHLDENPLETPSSGEYLGPVFLFDGLDELSHAGRSGKEVADRFIDDLIHLLSRKKGQNPRIRAIITGRDLVLQHRERDFEAVGQVLEALPYILMDTDEMKYEGERTLKNDQQQAWWEKYLELKGRTTAVPAFIQHEDFREVSIQPLLNFLIALSYLDDPSKYDQGTHELNSVYEDFLKRILKRPWGDFKHTQNKWELDEFKEVMEEVAVAAWHQGDVRGTSFAEVQKRCKGSSIGRMIEGLFGDGEAAYLRLLTAFYAKPNSDSKEKSFEFTHKSFGEYLLACGMYRLVMQELEESDRRGRRYEEKDALAKVIHLFRNGEMDPFIDAFLCREFQKLGQEEAKKAQKLFVRLFEHAIYDGFVLPDPNILDVISQTRKILSGLLFLMAGLSDRSREVSDVDWRYEKKARHVLTRLIVDHDAPVLKALRRLKLSMEGKRVDLRYFSFQGADLSAADFRGADFRGADLSAADLRGADLKAPTSKAPTSRNRLQKIRSQSCRLRRNRSPKGRSPKGRPSEELISIPKPNSPS